MSPGLLAVEELFTDGPDVAPSTVEASQKADIYSVAPPIYYPSLVAQQQQQQQA